MQHYDFIIAGGGCAGLSLAYYLIHSPLRDRSILIVDRDDKDQNDRTWAFWTDHPTPYRDTVCREWNQLRVASEGGERMIPTEPWRYVMIRGDDWYAHVRQQLAQRPNVTWLKAHVRRIEDAADGALVYIDCDGRGPEPAIPYHASWVFDSRFNIATFKPESNSTLYLQQHFKGWYIETPEDRLDPEAATIFDFRTAQEGEMRFFYLLPISPRSALVEYVGLHLVDFDPLLDHYLRDVLGIAEYKVVSEESGITPMTDHHFERRSSEHVMAVGIQGGLAKATTGYAFTRIQEDSQAIVASLIETGSPFDVPPVTKPAYRFLDQVMLQVMQTDPTCLKEVFGVMFAGNPGPRIFRFLDERAALRDVVMLVLTLPKRPFLAALVHLARLRLRAGNREEAAAAGSAHPSLKIDSTRQTYR